MEVKNLTGKEILNYRIESFIGGGGMGSVWKATHKYTGEKAAIKVLNANFVESEIVRRKFVKEAQMLGTLSHQNIVQYRGFDENEDGVFLVMEYVDGITLDKFINEKNGPVVEQRAYPMFLQILDACAYAHRHGVVHCDIKPANIILTNDSEGNFVVKILDFGIAKVLSESREGDGTVAFTPAYASPEQIRNEDIDRHSDIYSLGVLLHQMLTGRAPYDATTLSKMEIEQKVVNENLPRMREFFPQVSDKMQRIVDRATQKDAAKRYQACGDFRTAMKNALDPDKLPKFVKYAAAAVILLLLGAGGWCWYYFVPHTYYYKDYAEQWGVPVGIGKADYKHREASYRFEKLEGKIIRVSHINSRGNIVEHHDSEHTQRILNDSIFYTGNGKVDYVKVHDRNGKTLYKKDYDENLKTVIFKHDDEFGTEMSLAANTTKLFTNPFNNSDASKSKISRHLLAFDEKGFLKKMQYAGFQNVSVCDNDGLHGREYVVDEKGRVIEEHYLGKDGTPKSNKAGLAIKKFEYDKNDDWTKVTYHAANGEFSSDGNGCPVVVLDNDRYGNRTKETYYDGDGNLSLRKDCNVAGFSYQINNKGFRTRLSAFGTDGAACYYGNLGFHSIENEHDDNGYLSKEAYKDIDGNPVSRSERDGGGFAASVKKNDSRGNVLEEQYLDADGQPCENNSGFSRIICEYDLSGNRTSVFYYDNTDSLCLNNIGIAGQRSRFNDKNQLVEYTNYGLDNQACENVNGIVTVKFEYDVRGNQTKIAFYEVDGQALKLSKEGLAGWKSEYDEEGNEIKREFFDVSNSLTPGLLGYAAWNATYKDSKLDEWKYLDKDGNLIYVKSAGYAGIKYKYDERGNCTEEYPYGTGKNLTGYITRCKYDRHDNRIEIACYNQSNKPVFGEYGYFKLVSVYDRNQEIEQKYYNSDNILFAPESDNYAIVRYKYDSRGNRIEVCFFNKHDKPVCKKDGYATHKSEYDPMGRIVRQTYFDENGQSTKPSVMVPEGLVGYDKWGNMNYIASADGNGNLIDNPQSGWAVKRWIYDIKGNRLEVAVFDKDSVPCIDKSNNAHKITCIYNKHNNAMEEYYYSDADNLRKTDFAMIKYRYNEQNLVAEKHYYSDAGNLRKTDFAMIKYRYNEQNLVTEERYYSDADNLRRTDFAIIKHRYNEQDRETERSWFNYLGNPVNYLSGFYCKVTWTYDEQGNYLYVKFYNTGKTLLLTRKWNGKEWVNVTSPVPAPANGWRQYMQNVAANCPFDLDSGILCTSVSLSSGGCTIQLQFTGVSKYRQTADELEACRDFARQFAESAKEAAKMPSSVRLTVVGIDKSKIEFFRINN
ncbi:MAG: serine/threonine protein kinase [Prevotellaceae bacterium]|jgi:serine/threonine-protein kinase|nr:serine/threonine protein kinase [Prevotellaceae bacterium]